MSRLVKDWIDGYMEYQFNTEPPEAYIRWTAISVLAGALQRKCYLQWGEEMTFYPNMYIVLVGPPGAARKSTAMYPGRKFLNDLGVPLSAESTTREGLIELMGHAEDNYTLIKDTGETVMKTHSSLTVYSSELAVFLGQANYALLSDLCDWFDCHDLWHRFTKTQGEVFIRGLWLNILGATTPDLIRSSLPMDLIGGGLASRIIFVYEHRKGKIVPIPSSTPEERQLRARLMQDLEHINKLTGQFKVTQDFVDRWLDWYPRQDDNPPFNDRHLQGYLTRRPAHLLKLSMICSVSHSDRLVITGKDFDRAESFLSEVERSMPSTFSGVGKNRNADVLSSIMQEIALRNEITYGELLDTFKHDVNAHEFESIIKTLTEIGYCIEIIRGAKGQNLLRFAEKSVAEINESINAQLGDKA